MSGRALSRKSLQTDFKQSPLIQIAGCGNRLLLINSEHPFNYPFRWSIMQTRFHPRASNSNRAR